MAVNTCYPAVVVNVNEGSSATWKEAAKLGFKVGRVEMSGKAKAVAEAAKAAGMKASWLINLSSKSATLSGTISEYNALSAELKAVVIAFEWGNENWGTTGSETGIGPYMKGTEYAESFINAAKEQREKLPGMVLIMTTRIAPPKKAEWMESMFSGGKAAAIKTALIGNGTEANPQNWLQSHPYGVNMMTKQQEPANLANPKDANGNEWGAERWMQEAQWVHRETGLNCSLAITEYGTSYEKSGYSEQAKQSKELWEFAKLVKEGKVPSANLPSASYEPKLAYAAWYSLYGNKYTGSKVGNPFGLIFYVNEPNEEGTPKVYKTTKEGTEALTAAGEGSTEPAPTIGNPGNQKETVGTLITPVIVTTEHATGGNVAPLPEGLVLGGTLARAEITGTPTKAQTVTSTITAEGPGGTTTAMFTWEVTTSVPSETLLLGDPSTAYTVEEPELVGRQLAVRFAAKQTGTLKELQFRTAGHAVSGITGLHLGVFADSHSESFGIAAGSDLVNETLAYDERELADIASHGATFLRMDFDWSVIQPSSEASFTWAKYDEAVNAVVARGLKIIATITYTPGWANGGHTGEEGKHYPPLEPAKFAAFTKKVAERYSTRVAVFEIWNEPNIGFYKKAEAKVPTSYFELLKKSFEAVKEVLPGTASTVISGGCSPSGTGGENVSPQTWVAELYSKNAGGSTNLFDAVGYHPYCDGAPVHAGYPLGSAWDAMADRTGYENPAGATVRKVMEENSDGAKHIWATEVGASWELLAPGKEAEGRAKAAERLKLAFEKWAGYTWGGGAGAALCWFTYHQGAPNVYGLVEEGSPWTSHPEWEQYAELVVRPGTLLAQGHVTETVGANTWVKVTLTEPGSVGVTAGTRYWLAVLPAGTAGSHIYFNYAHGELEGGNPSYESRAEGLGTLTEEAGWKTKSKGPVGFQGVGSLSSPSAQATFTGVFGLQAAAVHAWKPKAVLAAVGRMVATPSAPLAPRSAKFSAAGEMRAQPVVITHPVAMQVELFADRLTVKMAPFDIH